MSTNDLMSEAVEAVGGWQAYIARKRRELEGQIAELHDAPGTPSAAPVSLTPTSVTSAFPQEPPPTVGVSAVEVAAEPTNSDLVTTPSPLAEISISHEADADVAPSNNGEGVPAEDDVVPPATNAEDAGGVYAQLEAAWHEAPPERLPQMVQDAYAQRDAVPDVFAQLMVGASASGYLTPALEEAVAALEEGDTHFQAAHLLFQDPQFAGLFEIAMDARDYGDDDTSAEAESDYTDDISAEGEADRAAANGEEPF